jgi:N-acetylglucosamine kinase-like BadF-type ATPase
MTSKQNYFLGADVGGTKTRVVIADQTGRIVGFGQSGPGNHEVVGYDGLSRALSSALKQALPVDIELDQIAGAGFGVGGLDFPSETQATLDAISALGLSGPVAAVNDTMIGLLAGSPNGWGVAVVSGTGCNCWGSDPSRRHIGRVSGHGLRMGEGAGASELVEEAVRILAYEWTKRGPATRLTPAFIKFTGARDLDDLVEGLLLDRYEINADAAPLIFEVAEAGDEEARKLIEWAGRELGELAKAVIRQLDFQELAFDVVLSGSMFDGGPRLIDPLKRTVLETAPLARFIRLQSPPVIGAVLLGMEASGIQPGPEVRSRLEHTIKENNHEIHDQFRTTLTESSKLS